MGFLMVGLRWIIGGLRWWVCCNGGFVGFAVMVGLWVCCDGRFVGFLMVVCGGLSVGLRWWVCCF